MIFSIVFAVRNSHFPLLHMTKNCEYIAIINGSNNYDHWYKDDVSESEVPASATSIWSSQPRALFYDSSKQLLLCIRFDGLKTVAVSANSFRCIFDSNGQLCVVKSIFFTCSANNFLNRFADYKTENVTFSVEPKADLITWISEC